MQPKIPCTVITGFLGAGKTTLVQSMLSNPDGRRLALIINEFGDAGVDGDLVKSCGLENCRESDVVELANGCICCTVADDFIPTLTKLLDRTTPPDHIVIETSGLALPQPLLRAFAWPEVKARVTVDGVVTVVDAQAVAQGRFASDEAAVDHQRQHDDNLDHDSPLGELFADQLACADLVVLSKSDLVDEAGLATVQQTVDAGKRSAAKVVVSGTRKPPIGVLLGVGAEAELDALARKSRHEQHQHQQHGADDHHHNDHHNEHDHDAFETFVVAINPVVEPALIAERVAKAGNLPGVLRIKGFTAIENKPMRLVLQAVGPRVESYFDRPWHRNEAPSGQLVVIGLAGMDRAAIAEHLQRETA